MPDHFESMSAALADRYMIDRELGRGGMATVYLARDVRHARQVAIKVLHPELAAVLGAERFLAEIKTTANLQHPHILPLFDSGAADGQLFYVMPFVEGETLRAKLDRETQLPIDDAVRIAREVADALQYAHEHGVIHRDIKPENILLQGGHALVADFGIALAVQHAGGQRMTQTGLSLGTPQYMAPEQAMGDKAVDARADVFALGAMTYEMLAGEPPFTGPTAQAIIARVLTTVPESLSARRPSTPPHLEAAVQHALEKLPADRFASAGQFAQALLNSATVLRARSVDTTRLASRSGSRGMRAMFGASIAIALTGALVATWAIRGWRSARDQPVVRFSLSVGDGAHVGRIAVSPDGRQFAWIADSAGMQRLYVRALDTSASRVIAGIQGLSFSSLAFSPDSKSLAFLADGKLKRVPVAGGTAVPIADASNTSGICWASGDVLVVSQPATVRGAGLLRVNASGGPLEPFTSPESGARGELHSSPTLLPDGRNVLLLSYGPGGVEDDFLAIASLETGKVQKLSITGWPVGMIADRLLYRRFGDEALMAVAFDLTRLRVAGEPVVVAEAVREAAVSSSGVLMMRRGGSHSSVELVSSSGAGRALPGLAIRSYIDPRLSPDGNRLAINVNVSGQTEVWIYEIANATFSRLTPGSRPEWTPDGKRVMYRVRALASDAARSRTGFASIAADLSGPSEVLALRSRVTDGDIREVVSSPDARTLLLRRSGGIWSLPTGGDSTARPFVQDGGINVMPRFSPDGRWVVYQSSESGQFEIYVRPFPGPGGRVQVSAGGGTEPLWSADGDRVYYRDGSKIESATVVRAPEFRVTSRAVLFEGDFLSDANHPQYDVTRDGQFVMLRAAGDPASISVVLNWQREGAGKR